MKYIKITGKIFFTITLIICIVFAIIYSYALNQVPSATNVSQTIELYDNNGNIYMTMNNGEKRTYVTLNEISTNVINAFITIEDKTFFDHKGFDLKRIVKAMYVDVTTGKKKQGASTISQQYARNLYLSNEKTWKRKISEAFYTVQLESYYTKDELLEGYLNTIYFGHGIYGIQDASLYYFNKNAYELTIEESAILAAIPKYPLMYSPINDYELNKERKNLILTNMLEDSYITETEYEKAINTDPTIIGNNPNISEEYAPYYQDIVINELEKLHLLNDPNYQILKVYTTLDPTVNDIIVEAVESNMDGYELETAVYAMDPKTGYVLGLVGGKNYELSQFNRATDALRQPGSTIKPFLYYSALEHGFSATTTFQSQPTTFYVNNGEEKYSPTNFADIYYYDDITMAYAIAVSDNIYAIKTHLFLGEENLVETLRRFGFSSELEAVPSLALGTNEVSLQELTTGYAYFASKGKEVHPIYIKKIYDKNENIIYFNQQDNKKQILNEENTFIMNDLLTGIFDTNMTVNISVTGASLAPKLQHTYSAKSGSTDYDNWIVGYNPEIVVGVWSGYDDAQSVDIREERFLSKYIWYDVVENYMNGREDSIFIPTEGLRAMYVNPITGEVASTTAYNKALYFKVNQYSFLN